MAETFKRVKESLVALLQDQDHKVIALTGKWGTGKTYLWRSVEKQQFENAEESGKAIYVSLFGVRTISDFKLRILQNTHTKDDETTRSFLKTSGSNALAGIVNKFTGISAESMALTWLPQFTKGRLIVIDDLERKHKSLDIDEVLGFLDEYSETHKTRFLILLNTDKLLENKAIWETLHEKVIDAEVVLDPSAGESFDIAAEGNSSPYLAEARKAVETLGIRNIRVIKRILRAMKRVADATVDFPSVSTSHWVASTALLTACHYRAVENPPPFEYVKSFNPYIHMFDDKKIKRAENELAWDLLLNKLGIPSADVYEEIMQSFLQTGLLDIDGLKKLFKKYQSEETSGEIYTKKKAFFDAYLWDVHLSDRELIVMAKEFLALVKMLDAGAITDIISVVEKLGDAPLARQLLDAWLQSVDIRPEAQQLAESVVDSNHRQYHPEIVAKLTAKRNEQHPPLTVLETAERIIKNNGWGEREKNSLRNSSTQHYEAVLKQITGNQLRDFVSINLEWAKNTPYDDNFKIGTAHFLAACCNTYSTDCNSRLSMVIYRAFEANGLADKLHATQVEQTL